MQDVMDNVCHSSGVDERVEDSFLHNAHARVCANGDLFQHLTMYIQYLV